MTTLRSSQDIPAASVAWSDDMSAQIAPYLPMIDWTGRRFESGRAWKDRIVVELDDLVQEGMIAAWEALQAGHPVSKLTVEHSMIDWRRHCAYLAGQGTVGELTEDVEDE